MISIERILCPVTLPQESDEALPYAVSLASVYDANLLLCHCAGAPALLVSTAIPTNGGDYSQVRTSMAESLAPLIARTRRAKPRFEVIVAEGGKDVGEEIVSTARDRRVDLIVMRARRSRVAALLGSTAEQVSRTASCPVLVIHADETAEANSRLPGEFARVLVSHDFSSSSELALSYALSIAQKFRAELHLLHVLPEPEENEAAIAWNEGSVETAYQRAMRRLQFSVPDEIYKRCKVTQVVRWGKPYREVLAYAKEQDVGLVCMGALGRDFGLQALFGSNVDRVLRQTSCPTLVARPFQAALPGLFGSRVTRPSLKSEFVSGSDASLRDYR